MLRSDAKHRVSKYEGSNTRLFSGLFGANATKARRRTGVLRRPFG